MNCIYTIEERKEMLFPVTPPSVFFFSDQAAAEYFQ
jgi:hypothetical protein